MNQIDITSVPGTKQVLMNSTETEFKPYRSIGRQIYSPQISITEKIDGTNAQLLITEDGQLFAGSRSRWITPERDNFGFAAWVEENKAQLLKELTPGRYYGEWWGKGLPKDYGQETKHFSIFDNRPLNCPLVKRVPTLYFGAWEPGIVEEVFEKLRNQGSKAAPGFMFPEGIVAKLEPGATMWKMTYDNPNGKWAGKEQNG